MADLITIDEYKAFSSIEGKNKDPQVAALITSCSEIVQDYLGYELGSSGALSKRIRTRKGVTEYMLPGFDLDIKSITYTARSMSPVVIDEEDYEVEDYGKLTLYSILPHEGDIITVSYEFNTTVLESIKLAMLLLVKYYYKEEFNKTSTGMGGQTVTYQTGKNFPPHVRAILTMYRMF